MRLFIILLLVAAFPTAAQVCPALEFAELDAMKADELLTMRCQYRDDRQKVHESGLGTQSLRGNTYVWNITVRCSDEMARMDRIIVRKLNITPPDITKHCDRK